MNDFLYRLIRPHYQALEGYISAGMEAPKDDSKTFMNANENPFELPGLEGFNRYPQPQPPALAEAYARAYGVEADQIVMTRGADEAIVILTKVFCEPISPHMHPDASQDAGANRQRSRIKSGMQNGDAVLICPPTFGMYGVDARAMPAAVIEVPLIKHDGTFALDTKGIIKAVYTPDQNIKIIYLCSPNNPTGTCFDHADIKTICAEVEGEAVVVLDETYAEFSAQGSLAAALNDIPNLIILRTLSKSYAFAGMRMGCFLCGDPEFVALVKSKCLDAYPLPKASIEAAFHVLSPEISTIAKENIKKLLAERDRVIAAFKASPHVIHVYPSDANFFLVKMKDAQGFYKFAADNNIILRDFSSKPGTENCLRISIGLPAHNDTLIKLLHDFVP